MGDLPAGAYYAVHLASAIFSTVPGRISRAVKFLLDALESNELLTTESWKGWQAAEKGPPTDRQHGGA